jgi:hypothetical protein
MKKFKCKFEELLIIAGFILYNLKRDLADFTAFSPKFDCNYVAVFDAKVKMCSELITT